MNPKLIAPLPILALAIGGGLLTTAAPASAAPAKCGNPGGILYYANTDGSAVALDMQGNEVATILAPSFTGGNPGAAREIAFDPDTRLMWYSATDGQLYSVNVDTLAAGPSIRNVPDASPGAGRHVFIDYLRNRVVTPLTNGSALRFRAGNQRQAGTYRSTVFPGANAGAFRHLTYDPRSGNYWYSVTDGSITEHNGATGKATGRKIRQPQLRGANPGAFRHLAVDPVRNILLYAVTDGSIAAVNLATLKKHPFTISAAAFRGANPGAARTITYDPQTGGTLSVAKSVAFGPVKRGRAAVKRVSLTNTGQLPLTGSIRAAGKAFGRVGGAEFCLAPGQKANVKVRFKPTNKKKATGKLIITSSAGKSTTTVKLAGKGR